MKEFLNIKDICEILNISERHARRLFNYKNLQGRKVGNKWITTKQSLINYIERTG